MTVEQDTMKELRREWSDHESNTRQSRTYALQKLSIYSGFAQGEELRQALKVILAPEVLARNVSQDKIDAFMHSIDDRSRQYMFSDLIEPLDLFRPFEVAMFDAAIGGRCLHDAFVSLEAYYDWYRTTSPSAYSDFYYRLALLLEAGVTFDKALGLTGAKSYKLYELVTEMSQFYLPGQTVAEFFKASDFPEWIVLVLKAAERQGRSAVALRKLADYSTKALTF